MQKFSLYVIIPYNHSGVYIVPKNKKNRSSKKSTKFNKGTAINKAVSNTTAQRASKKQFATAAITAVDQIVNMLKPYELSRTQRLKTYQCMLSDDAVFSALDSRLSLIQKSQAKGKFLFDKNSPESVRVKDFFEYCMDNLQDQTVGTIGRTAADHIYNGFAPFEMVYEAGEDEWKDLWKLKKLVYIHPLTLNQAQPFETDKIGDTITGIRQDFSAFTQSTGLTMFSSHGLNTKTGSSWNGEFIDWRKVAYCSYSVTLAEPFGNSPLDAAYSLWRAKQLLEDLGITGATRDMAGIPVIRLPAALLEAAAADPSSQEAAQVSQITTSMENMHKGDQSIVILPSDAHNEAGSGALEFDFKLLGVEGSSGNSDIEEMVDKKRKAIFTVLASRHLISGEDGGGSYSLHEGQAGIHAHFAARDSMIVDSMWNKQIFPKLLKLNGWKVSKKDLPQWVHNPVQERSDEGESKLLQRLGSVGLLPKNDPKFLNEVMLRSRFEYEFDETLTAEEVVALCGEPTTGAGLGDGTSGTGGSQSGGSNSSLNSDNAA